MSDFSNDISGPSSPLNPIFQFVERRIAELSSMENADMDDVAKQGVTVRFRSTDLAVLDELARRLKLSRQELLSEIFSCGINTALNAYANSFEPSKCSEILSYFSNLVAEVKKNG
jgi:hypothetical protein